jgi:hypothetical protein
MPVFLIPIENSQNSPCRGYFFINAQEYPQFWKLLFIFSSHYPGETIISKSIGLK